MTIERKGGRFQSVTAFASVLLSGSGCSNRRVCPAEVAQKKNTGLRHGFRGSPMPSARQTPLSLQRCHQKDLAAGTGAPLRIVLPRGQNSHHHNRVFGPRRVRGLLLFHTLRAPLGRLPKVFVARAGDSNFPSPAIEIFPSLAVMFTTPQGNPIGLWRTLCQACFCAASSESFSYSPCARSRAVTALRAAFGNSESGLFFRAVAGLPIERAVLNSAL